MRETCERLVHLRYCTPIRDVRRNVPVVKTEDFGKQERQT